MRAAVETRWTGLSAKQADALRAFVNSHKDVTMPVQPMERVRMYYEKVIEKPVPQRVIAATQRPVAAPECTKAALVMIENLGLDAAYVKGTGPNGKIGVGDVRKHLSGKFGDIAEAIGDSKIVELLKEKHEEPGESEESKEE